MSPLTLERDDLGSREAMAASVDHVETEAISTPAQSLAITSAMENIDPKATSISAGLPTLVFQSFALPPMTWSTLWIILPFSIVLAAVGLIESLMTLTLIDEITETQGSSNRECLGQGIANIACGLFGGMGGCAMIGQSLGLR